MQFHSQKNNDLPTKIYEFVIDNIEILTYNCIDRDFECDKCKNFEDCLKNAQGFILIVNISNEQNILDSRERLQKIVNKCTEIENKQTPIIIIGNKFKNQKEIDPKFVQNQFNLAELTECGIKIKYFSINILKEKGKIMEILRWLVSQMI
jgi:GTPase SAR1 family protein